jgi:hypothetical protein
MVLIDEEVAVGCDTEFAVGVGAAVDVPDNGGVQQETRRMALRSAKTIHRWWNWHCDRGCWNKKYIPFEREGNRMVVDNHPPPAPYNIIPPKKTNCW